MSTERPTVVVNPTLPEGMNAMLSVDPATGAHVFVVPTQEAGDQVKEVLDEQEKVATAIRSLSDLLDEQPPAHDSPRP